MAGATKCSPPRTFHSPDPVTPVQNPRQTTPISPARKLVLPLVTTSPRGRFTRHSTPAEPVFATPEALGERDQAIARIVATRWLFVSRRQLASCVARVSSIAASQLCSQLATCCWWAWTELRRDSQNRREHNSIAFKHAARCMVSRYIREWRHAVELRSWVQHMNTVAIRHWAYSRQLCGWRAWQWTIRAEVCVSTTRAKRARLILWRSLEAWADCTPFVDCMGCGQTRRSPSLVEWSFCTRYRNTRQVALSIDTWSIHVRCMRRIKLQVAKSWQHYQYAMLLRTIRAWESYLVTSKKTKTAYRQAVAFHLRQVFASWVHVKRLRCRALEAQVQSQRLCRARVYMHGWQSAIEYQRANDAAQWMHRIKLQSVMLSRWRRATKLAAALRAMDEVATGVALSRLARKSIDRWVIWRGIQQKTIAVRQAADRHYRNVLALNVTARWRLFVCYRVRRCRLQRKARHHRRSRTVRRAFGIWTCYLARIDKEYAALQLALKHRQRVNTRGAFIRWQQFKAVSQARRLQFLHAEGHREAVLSAEMLRRWCELIEELRRMRSCLAAACRHAAGQLQGSILYKWSQAAQLSATLRWAKQSRLSTLRASLGVGKLRRSLRMWAVEFVAAARAKATLQQRAVNHFGICRLRVGMAKLTAFLTHRRWMHRQWSVAEKQYGTRLLASTLAAMVQYRTRSVQARSRRSIAVRHSHMQLLSESWDKWNGYVTKRRAKAAAETVALASFRTRLLLHGCRSWLTGGLRRRTARVELVLVAESERATTVMATVERLARHWRNITLERSPNRQLTRRLHRANLLTSPVLSTRSFISSATTQVTPVVSTLGNALTETPLHAAAPRTSCLAPRVRPAPRRPALLFGATPVPSAFVNDDDIARGRALHKLPQPKTTGLKRLSSPAKAKMAPESREERDTSLAQMEAVLSGYRELKDLRQRARAALHRATDTSNTQEAIDRNRSAVSQQRCCEEVEELRVQVRDLEMRCAEQLPAVRAVAARLQELQTKP